ncbi:MAG: glycine oxidase ThiO [Dehalococcoidia bacterium]
MISLTINGKPRTFEHELSVLELLRALAIDARLVAVAINGEVVPKKQHAETSVHDGDLVEIVRMVGGGSSKLDPRSSKAGGSGAASVVIVGAGIVGCAIAYELSRRGVASVVLDSRRAGMAATNAAAGIVAPLAEFQRPGPLVRFGLEGLRRYPVWRDRLLEDVPDIDVELDMCGVLRVAFEEDELAELRRGLRYREELGVELIELDQQMVRDAEPRLSERIVGGVLCPDEGHLSNQLFTLALTRAAKQRGARIVEGAPVTGFETSGSRVAAVRTPRGDFACDRVVLAAGAWTGQIAKRLRAHVPVFPVRGQMLALGRMVTPIHAVVWGPRGYVLPRANGLVFAGSTVEQVGFRIRTTQRGLAQVRRGAFELVPQLRHAREHFSWAGLRPGSPDGLPLLGALSGWDNVTLATGHYRNGILLGPITGELIADLIVSDRVPEALAPFDPARLM